MRVFTALPMTDWREAGPAARAAEDIGFDVLRTAELGHEVFIPLAFAALATERVELTPRRGRLSAQPDGHGEQAWDLQANSRGRFVLGLGSQVKATTSAASGSHGAAGAAAARYIGALRAIWRCWETRRKARLPQRALHADADDTGFSPEPTGLPMVPVTISAVGEAMLRVAGQVRDGVRLHPLCSRRYLLEICLPLIAEGLARCGRAREHLDVHGGGFVVYWTRCGGAGQGDGPGARAHCLYCSTRTYLPVLALHGLEELGAKAARDVGRRAGGMTWRPRSRMISCGSSPPAPLTMRLPRLSRQRFGDAADSSSWISRPTHHAGLQRELVADIRRIPHRFTGFDTTR